MCSLQWAWSTSPRRRRGGSSGNATRRAFGTGVSFRLPLKSESLFLSPPRFTISRYVICLFLFVTAVPFSVISMAVTQALVTRGIVIHTPLTKTKQSNNGVKRKCVHWWIRLCYFCSWIRACSFNTLRGLVCRVGKWSLPRLMLLTHFSQTCHTKI